MLASRMTMHISILIELGWLFNDIDLIHALHFPLPLH